MKPLLIIAAAISFVALSCNNSPTTTASSDSAATTPVVTKTDLAEKNKQTALASMEGINNHNVDQVFKDASNDIVDYGNGGGHEIKGIDSVKKNLQDFLNSFPDIKGENLMALADGNHVAVFGDWSGTFKKEMMGMKPTNKSFKMKDVDLFTFNADGKITEHHSVQSAEYMMMQIGTGNEKSKK